MKRLISLILASILFISVFSFVGCGGGDGAYREVSWEEMQKFIQSRENLPYDEMQVDWRDGYTQIQLIAGEVASTTITYTKDGAQLIFIEDAYPEEDGSYSYTTHRYYTGGRFYERVVEDGEEMSYEATDVDFETALFYSRLGYAGVMSVYDDLGMYYPYIAIGEEYKFYMAKVGTTTKVKVVNYTELFGERMTNTVEYVFDSDLRLVEYYDYSVDGKNQPLNETRIFPTKEAPIFPDLSGFPVA